MAEVTITIDGKKIAAAEGGNLLEVALQNGINIPHLCHDPRIKPFGSCRMCFVDTGGPRGPVAACGTAVEDGMTVVTDSEVLRDLRRTALELLLSEHCGDCIAPCQLACPAGIDIQGYIAYMDRGEYKRAADLIKEKMPLPSICGRVCPRFCEEQCRRSLVDEPVNICDLKRFAGDFDLDAVSSYAPAAGEDTGKKVAVVGGGPAGLTAAYYLGLEGHAVTLYDRGPELGGMLRYGIPAYRLPRELLDREAGLIAGICREVRMGEVLGRDFSLDDLRRDYDAVFLGPGCQAAQGMGLEREDLPGILRGIEFLRSVEEGSPPELGRRVAVVGGGNTAMDAARTALRLGAGEVAVIYRRSRDEMPANPVEIEEAEEEGIRFHYLTNPVSVLGDECVSGIECVNMKLGEPDESGRRRPIVVEGSEFRLELDNVIMAIGQSLDRENICGCSLEDSGKNLAACAETGCTPLEGVFAAGDAVTGPATVVEAVGAARAAAHSIDRYLKGRAVSGRKEEFNCSRGTLEQLDPEEFAGEAKIGRVHGEHLSPSERKIDFREYNPGLNEEEARRETGRCLSCGCQDSFDCTLRELAGACGIDTGRFGVEQKRYPVYGDHPYIRHDPNKCVLCASCVRICSEVQDVNALCLVNRGYDTVVSPALGLPLAEAGCESCGQCVSACPTGALSTGSVFARPGPWKDEGVVRTTCVLCSTGCILDLHMAGGRIGRVTSPLRGELNEGNLCVRGRFEHFMQPDTGRLLTPLVRDGNELREAGWSEAIAAAAEGLNRVRENHGAESIAVLVSPDSSNEEAYLAQKLARGVIGTGSIDSTAPVHGGASRPGERPVPFAALAGADLVLVVDADLPEDYPVVAQKVRRAVESGARLAVLSQQGSRLDKHAGLVIPVNPGKMQDVLKALPGILMKPGQESSLDAVQLNEALAGLPEALRTGPEALVELASAVLAAEKPVVITDGDRTGAAEAAHLEEALRLAGGGETGSIFSLSRGGNARGLLEMGVSPFFLPGGRAAGGRGLSSDQVPGEAAAEGKIKGILVIGDAAGLEMPPVNSGVFTVLLASSRPEGAAADVILPSDVFTEKKGTVINCEGRIGELNPASAPPAGRQNREIIGELAAALGSPLENIDPGEVLAEIRALPGCDLPAPGLLLDEGSHNKT